MSNKYEQEKFLGKGAYSSAYITSFQGKPAVIKKLHDVKNIDQVASEVDALQKVSTSPTCHPSIVCLYDYSLGPNPDEIYLVEEFIDGDDLLQYVRANQLHKTKLIAAEIFSIMKQLIEALDFVHSHDIVHRDIKLANVMIENETNKNKLYKTVKLIDFGLSCSDTQCPTAVSGTPNYIAPELWLQLSKNKKALNAQQLLDLYKSADVWALGILGYYLIHGKFPFTSKLVPALKQEILSSEDIISDSGNPELDELISLMLVKDPKYRATASELKDNLPTMEANNEQV